MADKTGEHKLPGGKNTEFRLEDFLPFNIRVVAAAISTVSQTRVFEKFNLTIAEWRVIVMVNEFSRISTSEIADKLDTDRPLISRGISKLIRKGFLDKAYQLKDQRRQELTLTDTGEKLCASIIPLVKEFEKSFTKCLSTTEVRELQESLRKIEKALKEM